MKFTAFVLATAAASASAQILSQNPFAGVNFGAAYNPYAVAQPLYNPYPIQQPYPIVQPRPVDPLTWERDCTWINAVDFRNKLSQATCGSNLCTAGPNLNGGGHTRVNVRQMKIAGTTNYQPLGYHVWGSVINRAGRVCAVAYTGADLTKQFPYGRILSMKLANTANNLSLPDRAMPSHVRHFYPNNNRGLIMNGAGNSQYAVGGQNSVPGGQGVGGAGAGQSSAHATGSGSYNFNSVGNPQVPADWTSRRERTDRLNGPADLIATGGNRNQGGYGDMGDSGSMHLNNEPELDEHSDTAWDVEMGLAANQHYTIANKGRHRASYVLNNGANTHENLQDNALQFPLAERTGATRSVLRNSVTSIAPQSYPSPTMVWAAESSWFGFTLPAEQFNPGNIDVHYQGATSNYGEACGTARQDPMCMQKPGGVAYSAGGLALYDSAGVIRGAIGVAGDNDCTNHAIAWKARKQLNLDYVPGNKGNFAKRDDETLLDTEGRAQSQANQAIRNANALVNDYEVHWAGKGAEDNVIFSVKEHYMFPYCQALIRNFKTLQPTNKNPLYAGV